MILKKEKLFLVPSLLLFLSSLPVFPLQQLLIWKNPPKKKLMENGLTLLYQKDESSSITVLVLLIRGGKRAEPEGKEGLAYLTTRLMIEIPDRGKVQSLMRLSSHISMNSRGDYSLIRMACLSDSLEDTLKIIAKIISDPLFSGMRINWIKERMRNRRKREEDDPRYVAHLAYRDLLLTERGYGGPFLGSEESLKNIKKKDIVNFYKSHHRSDNIVLAVCSDLGEEEIFNLCSKYFTEFSEGTLSREELSRKAKKKAEKQMIIKKDTKQSLVSLGFPLPELNARNFSLATLLETLLGKGAGSKLWPLRSEEKLAYVVDARATQMEHGGLLEVYLETDHSKKERARKALKEVLERLYEEGVTEEELQAAKIQAKASFLRINETKEERTKSFAAFEALGLGYQFLTSYFHEIDQISLEEMNACIKQILDPQKSVEVIVGPEDKKKNSFIQTRAS
ncbi:MAG: M16 family metallopeptidase [Candidatus Aminicenantales bacterium]